MPDFCGGKSSDDYYQEHPPAMNLLTYKLMEQTSLSAFYQGCSCRITELEVLLNVKPLLLKNLF